MQTSVEKARVYDAAKVASDLKKRYRFFGKLAAYPFVTRLVLFGSRARGTGAERSDIDIAVECATASAGDWQALLDVAEEADTLNTIDLIRFDQLAASDPLRESIARDGVVLYEATG